jgi:hypothetical protein
MHLLDGLEAAWIVFIFILAFFSTPAYLFPSNLNSDALLRAAGNWARMTLLATFAIELLSRLRALNATTVISLFAGAIAAAWLSRNAASPERLKKKLQTATVRTLQWLESRPFALHLLPRAGRPAPPHAIRRSPASMRRWFRVVGDDGNEMLWAGLAAVLLITVILGEEHAVRELRLDQPEQYEVLLHTRELLLNRGTGTTPPEGGRPLVFPPLIAITSLLSGRDPMQVTRFLSPAVGILIVLATGLLLRTSSRRGVACLAAMYCIGAAAFPPTIHGHVVPTSLAEKLESVLRVSPANLRAPPNLGLGMLFLLLALAILADWYQNSRSWRSLLDFSCCLVLVGLVSPSLVPVLTTIAAVLLLQPMLGIVALVVLCYGWSVYATVAAGIIDPSTTLVALPIAAAIGVGCLFALTEAMLARLIGRSAEAVLLSVAVAVAVIWFPPHRFSRQSLEDESAARVTQRIVDRFPRQTWVVAAPAEQLAETFGLGAYEDLAGFVGKYQDQTSDPDFRFPDAKQDLFIYVEKNPFQIFSQEPEFVSFPVLTDVTYRNYRSPGGRASLESAALRLCEKYRQFHGDVDIFFEDENLRVYHIRRQPPNAGSIR